MRSIVEAYGSAVDARHLIIEGTYYSLTNDQVECMINDIIGYLCNKYEAKCVFDWGKGIKDIKSFIHEHVNDSYYSIRLKCYKKSELVYNKTSLRKYESKVTYPAQPRALLGTYKSIDYDEHYDRIVEPSRFDPEAYKRSILQFFDKEGMVPKCEMLGQDIMLFISGSNNISNGVVLNDGGIMIQYKFYTFYDELDQLCQDNLELCRKLLSKYRNINLCFQSNRFHLMYTRYYGYYPSERKDELRKKHIWDRVFQLYQREVGFAHFISNDSRKLGVDSKPLNNTNRIVQEEVDGGGLIVRANVPMPDVTVNDLKILKKSIYSTVLPRESVLPYNNTIRSFWEMVPVFDNELFVTEKGLRFIHYGEINTEYLESIFLI